VRAPAPRSLVPPRPNLGPEPWSEPQSSWIAFAALWLGFVIIVTSVIVYGVLRKRRVAPRMGETSSAFDDFDTTPRERLIGLSKSLRGALSDRFGAAYRARTTEELASDVKLSEFLGASLRQELIEFFDQVDQLKFAPERAQIRQKILEEDLSTRESRVNHLIEQIGARPPGMALKNGESRRGESGVTPQFLESRSI